MNMNRLASITMSLLFGFFLFSGCSSDDPEPPIDCSQSDLQLAIDEVVAASSCNQADGSLTVSAVGGTGGTTFSINGTDFQSSGNFTGLEAGTYEVIVQDANNCEATISASVGVEGLTLAINTITSSDSGCKSSNGQLTINATGQGAVMYKLGQGAFQSSNTFGSLSAGSYAVVVKDESNCEISGEAKVLTGVSYSQQVESIITANCAISGCHNGDNGSNRNWTVFSNVQNNAGGIKSQTQSGSMPPSGSGRTLSQQQKDLIACWVDDGALDN